MSFKKGFVYVFISNLIGVIISIITGFVLPKMLSIATYSNVKLFQLYISYVGILHLGYSDGMYLKYGGQKIEDIDKKAILSEFKMFKLFQVVIAIMGLIVTFITKNQILFFCMLSVIPINVGNYLRNLYQATGNFDKYAKFTNINTLLMFFMNLFLLFIIKADRSDVYMIAYVIAYFIYWLLLEHEIQSFFENVKAKPKFQYLIDDIHDGFLLMLGNFSNVLFTSIDRLLVKKFLGMVQFAYYSFSVSIENLMNTVIGPISIVMYNYVCRNSKKEQILFAKNMLLMLVALLIAFVFPVAFIVQNWIGKYTPALNVLYFLFAAQYFSMIVKCIYNNLYKAQKKQNRYFVVMIIIITVSVVLNLLGYHLFKNMEIFAIATMATSIIWFIIGEVEFREYHYSVKQYGYIFLTLLFYFVSSLCFQPILGFFLYMSMFVFLTLLLLPKEVQYLKNQINEYYHKIKKSGGKK